MKLTTLCLVMGLFTFSVFSQQIKVNEFQIDENGLININFSIDESHSPREAYEVLFYSSVDDFREPISFKAEGVKPGENEEVSFSGSEQFGGYEGSFQLKLVAQATTFPIKINSLDKPFKIGKNNSFSWQDFHDSGPYNVSLYQNGEFKSQLASSLSTNTYAGKIPKSLEKGNYSILVSPIGDEAMFSEQVPVELKKATNPLIFLGVAALAGGGLVLSGGGDPPGGGSGGGTGTDTGLPDPPGPPTDN